MNMALVFFKIRFFHLVGHSFFVILEIWFSQSTQYYFRRTRVLLNPFEVQKKIPHKSLQSSVGVLLFLEVDKRLFEISS
ncbi:hypothetical protein JL36_06440 [Lactococcus cremoris]|nr:hypothetical protein JL36_06440 [Lactococcus cremoris]